MSAISRRQRAIHWAAPFRSSAICSNVRPSPSSVASLPLQFLPALDDDVNVLRIELDAVADALGEFGGGQRGAAAQERLVHQLAPLGVVQDRAPHQIDRLLRRVIELLLVGCRP